MGGEREVGDEVMNWMSYVMDFGEALVWEGLCFLEMCGLENGFPNGIYGIWDGNLRGVNDGAFVQISCLLSVSRYTRIVYLDLFGLDMNTRNLFSTACPFSDASRLSTRCSLYFSCWCYS